MTQKLSSHLKREHRVRAHILAVSDRPRLVVHRSNNHISAQVIGLDGKTIASATSQGLKTKGTKTEIASQVGKALAEKIKGKIEAVVFDRGAYRFHGRVKALAESVRESGIKF